MLYFYKYIPYQKIEKLHQFMEYYFIRVFGEVTITYDPNILIHSDFINIVDKNKATLGQFLLDFFIAYNSIADPNEKLKIIDAYYINNNIEAICEKELKPVRYGELPAIVFNSLSSLYGSKGILYKLLTATTPSNELKNQCGTLLEHFKSFRGQNKLSVCPFCGMDNIMTKYEDNKNEYDHYLPKGKYPFCSVNFKNLVPICDICNKQGFKGTKDIPFIPKSNPRTQEFLYYPYSESHSGHEIKAVINSATTDLTDLSKWNLNITCNLAQDIPKKNRWVEIYKIESRYKGKIAGDSYEWKLRIIDKHHQRCKKNKMPFHQFTEDILDDFRDHLKWNNGILRKSFDEFIINNPNCEDFLNGKITI